MPDRPSIKFRVDNDQKTDIKEYAKVKGFDTPANLARVALFYYMRKNPLTKRQAVSGTAG